MFGFFNIKNNGYLHDSTAQLSKRPFNRLTAKRYIIIMDHMKNRSSQIRNWLIPLIVAALLLAAALNITRLLDIVGKVLSAITPILIGLCIAFVLNIPMRFIENRLLSCIQKSKYMWIKKLRRPIALGLTVLIALGLISLVLGVIIPELINTLETIIANFSAYADGAIEWMRDILLHLGIPDDTVNTITVDWDLFMSKVLEFLQTPTVANTATSITAGIFSGVFNTVMAMIIAIYVLAQKEQVARFFKRLTLAVLSDKAAKKLFQLAELSFSAFTGFVRGQFWASFVLGVLCYIGMLIFGFPYAAAISVAVGTTALIPVVGAIIGAVLGALLLLLNSPLQALLFIIFLIILQQVEGNLIFPRIVGKTVGLPGILVLSAVIVGGGIYGIPGVIIGVPLSAVLYATVKSAMASRLDKKNAASEYVPSDNNDK